MRGNGGRDKNGTVVKNTCEKTILSTTLQFVANPSALFKRVDDDITPCFMVTEIGLQRDKERRH